VLERTPNHRRWGVVVGGHRAPRAEDVAEAAELRAEVAEQEARAQAAEVALHTLRKEVALRGDGVRQFGGGKPGLSEVRARVALGQQLAATTGVRAWLAQPLQVPPPSGPPQSGSTPFPRG